jgi:AcrR family transcriptional regulator
MALPDAAAAAPAPAAGNGKGDRTRSRLLAVAVERFARDGYRRTSVSDIARDAGVTPAAVYAYFAGKEALFVAAVDRDADALIEAARAAKTGATVVARLIEAVDALVRGVGEHPLARRVLAGLEPDVIGRLLDLPSMRALRDEMTDELRVAQASGEVRDDVDADDLARGVETIVLALLLGEVQAGPVDDDRVRGIGAVFAAALSVPTPARHSPR